MLRLDGRASRKTTDAEVRAFVDDVMGQLPKGQRTVSGGSQMPASVFHDVLLDGVLYQVKPVGFHSLVVGFGDRGEGTVLVEPIRGGMGGVCVSDAGRVDETAALWDGFVDGMGW